MNTLALLIKRGAILTGDHYLYSTGKHGSDYVDLSEIQTDAALMETLIRELALLAQDVETPSVIIGHGIMGTVLAYGIAREFLPHVPNIRVVIAERTIGIRFVFSRTNALCVHGQRILVIDDVINSGDTVRQLVRTIRGAGGIPERVLALCARTSLTATELGVTSLRALVTLPMETWNPSTCRSRGPCARGKITSRTLRTPWTHTQHGK